MIHGTYYIRCGLRREKPAKNKGEDQPAHPRPGFSLSGKCSGQTCYLQALRPKSTAMVMAGRSVHLTTLFHGQA